MKVPEWSLCVYVSEYIKKIIYMLLASFIICFQHDYELVKSIYLI